MVRLRASRADTLFDVRGLEHLQAALAKGRGVILFTGHFTTIEICGRALKRAMPNFTVMYAPRSNPVIDEMQRRGRRRVSHESVPHDNIRMMLRCLKRNAAIWYAPDQYYEGGALVPFFHELACTNVATSKLARMTGATVVPMSYVGSTAKRATRSVSTRRSRISRPTTRRPIQPASLACSRTSSASAPEQYLWNHRKFKGRPAPLPDLYAKPPSKVVPALARRVSIAG